MSFKFSPIIQIFIRILCTLDGLKYILKVFCLIYFLSLNFVLLLTVNAVRKNSVLQSNQNAKWQLSNRFENHITQKNAYIIWNSLFNTKQGLQCICFASSIKDGTISVCRCLFILFYLQKTIFSLRCFKRKTISVICFTNVVDRKAQHFLYILNHNKDI